MTRSRVYLVLAVLLAALGAWQIGEAGYMHAKALLAQHLLETSWARTVATGKPVKPWPWADTAPVARLTVPALDQEMIVLSGGSGRTLAFAPGHVDGSALPGRPGLSVIGGHRDTHFRFLRSLTPGTLLTLGDAQGHEHSYRVSDIRIVDARTVRLDPIGAEPALALVTCYPFDAVVPGGPLRYLVMAESVADKPVSRQMAQR